MQLQTPRLDQSRKVKRTNNWIQRCRLTMPVRSTAAEQNVKLMSPPLEPVPRLQARRRCIHRPGKLGLAGKAKTTPQDELLRAKFQEQRAPKACTRWNDSKQLINHLCALINSHVHVQVGLRLRCLYVHALIKLSKNTKMWSQLCNIAMISKSTIERSK